MKDVKQTPSEWWNFGITIKVTNKKIYKISKYKHKVKN